MVTLLNIINIVPLTSTKLAIVKNLPVGTAKNTITQEADQQELAALLTHSIPETWCNNIDKTSENSKNAKIETNILMISAVTFTE